MKELRIAHIDDAMTWRGGERQALELIKGLRDRGVENILVCRSGSELDRRAEKSGIERAHLPLRGEWDVISAFRMRSLFFRRKVQIAHAHTAHAHTIALMAVAGKKPCRLAVSRRVDFHVRGFLSRAWKYGSLVDRIISVSEAVRRVLIEDGIDPMRIVTIRSGFIPDEFLIAGQKSDLRRNMGIPDDVVVIANVAALAPHKAHGTLLRAARLVVQTHPRVVFLLAGEGPLRSEIEASIQNLGLQDSVKMLGFVTDISQVYRAADIFAISSEEEGLCSSLLDAMYFRLPLVATSAGGIPELISDGVNGFIVPVNDHVSFAERLCMLIERKDLRKQMGERSGPVLEENSIARTVEKTMEVYEKLVKDGDNERFQDA